MRPCGCGSKPRVGRQAANRRYLYTAGTPRAGGRFMIEDEVVLEVRAAREAFAASHGYDIRAMVAALRDVAVASGREVVSLPPRPIVGKPLLPQIPVVASENHPLNPA